ncbi:MAG: DUF6531 domain-containing protein, partial [Myxococcaceae bacterium]
MALAVRMVLLAVCLASMPAIAVVAKTAPVGADSRHAENVPYRFNFYSIAPREDFLSAGSRYTAEESIKRDTNGEPSFGRPISSPALAEFFFLPSKLRDGVASICTKLSGSGPGCEDSTLIKRTGFKLLSSGAYELVPIGAPPAAAVDYSPEPMAQQATAGLDGARRFSLPLPPNLGAMPGSSLESFPKSVYLVTETAGAQSEVRAQFLGAPVGKFRGTHARAPGQAKEAGLNLADGHLSFEHEDIAARQCASVLRFARTYNNQNKAPTPLGVGWTHNFDGYLVEEKPGRYGVVLAGQAYAFPKCTSTTSTSGTTWACAKTDNTHGGALSVDEPDIGGLSAVFTTVSGVKFRFDKASVETPLRGRRKWLLSSIDDGRAHPKGTQLKYLADTDLLEKVETECAGTLSLGFAYAAVTVDPHVPRRIQTMATRFGFQYLSKVSLVRGGAVASTLRTVEYSYDDGNLKTAKREPDLPKQTWQYEYAAVPSGLVGRARTAARNELEKAELHLSKADGTGDFVQWHGSFKRSGDKKSFGHVDKQGIVSEVRLPGQQGNPLKVGYTEAAAGLSGTREVTGPDGVVEKHTLNDYGNTNSSDLPLTSESAKWGSDSHGGAVRKSEVRTANGRRIGIGGFDAGWRPTSFTLDEVPTDPKVSHVVEAVSAGVQLTGLTLHPRYNVPTETRTPAPGGGQTVVSTPVDDAGNALGVRITENGVETMDAGVTSYSEDGVPLIERDAVGRLLTYTLDGGLPIAVKVKDPNAATGALGEVTRRLSYDELGRLTGIAEDETGASTSWELDSQGRKKWQERKGVPVERWNYEYTPSTVGEFSDFADVLYVPQPPDVSTFTIVSETLQTTHTPSGQPPTRKSYYQDGLLVGEKFKFGENDTEAIRKNKYVAGRLTCSVDERGYARDYTYDDNGRLRSVRVTDPGGVTHDELKYEF